MKTLLISLGLTALAGSASAFTRVVVARPDVVVRGPVCRPINVVVRERPAPYCAPVATFRARPEVVVRGLVCRPAPVCRPVVVVHPGHRH